MKLSCVICGAILTLTTGCLSPMRPLAEPQAYILGYQAARLDNFYAVGPKLVRSVQFESVPGSALSVSDSQGAKAAYANAVYQLLGINAGFAAKNDLKVTATNIFLDRATNWFDLPERTPAFVQALRAQSVVVTATNSQEVRAQIALAQTSGKLQGAIIASNRTSSQLLFVIENSNVVYCARAIQLVPSSDTFETPFKPQTLSTNSSRTEQIKPSVGFLKRYCGWLVGYYPMPYYWLERKKEGSSCKLYFCMGSGNGCHELRSDENGWFYSDELITPPIRLSENRARKLTLTLNAKAQGDDIVVSAAKIAYYEVKQEDY